MSILDRFTVTQYKIRSLNLRPLPDGEGSFDIIATFELALSNSQGDVLSHAKESITLTQQEKSVFLQFVSGKAELLEQVTGWTRQGAE